MSIINSQPLIGASGNQGYFLSKSLRFRSSASAYLNRTTWSSPNLQKYTWSSWIKRGALTSTFTIFGGYDGSSVNSSRLYFNSSDQLAFDFGGAAANTVSTTAVYRDPSAWYHIVLAIDTTQATAANRVILYVNGSQITALSSATYPTQNANGQIWLANQALIGQRGGNYFDGYMSEINYIDGQALTPSSFGETSTSTGVWIPKKYTGTYGTNGFYLPFTDVATTSGSNAGLGKDFSGNGNYWTTNNISVTSGSTYDSMKDVPTLTDATTANYAVWNPLKKNSSINITNGNLSVSGSTGLTYTNFGNFVMSSGKWYWENTVSTNDAGGFPMFGLTDLSTNENTNNSLAATKGLGYRQSGVITKDGSNILTGRPTFTNGDVISVAFDADTSKVWFAKNGTWINGSSGSAGDPAAGTNEVGTVSTAIQGYVAGGNAYNSASFSSNFGQQPFTYTPPTGFKALNTFNLPTPTIGATASSQANKYFNTVLWSGDGASTRAITGVGHAPDFVWIKKRTAGGTVNRDHVLYDIIRGTGANLRSNQTNAESTGNTDELKSFDSDGFSLGNGDNVNGSSGTPPYVGWAWKANGSGSSNTDGSVTSTVSVNTTSGFSIATVAAQNNTSTLTIGHGLGVAPKMIIGKSRSGVGGWSVWHTTLATNELLYLNSTAAKSVDGGTPPAAFTATSSTTFTVQNWNRMIGSGVTGVFYTFSEVAGYSKFGSYTGNGSTDGTFVYTGFRPRYIVIKSSSGIEDWRVFDTARSTYNIQGATLYPNTSSAENSGQLIDINSNGFKCRTTDVAVNGSGSTYIYMAFAESPFKFSNAR